MSSRNSGNTRTIGRPALTPLMSYNTQAAFRRILAREAGTGADAAAIAAAARRLCEHFADRLSPLIGQSGVMAVCARSLHLAQRKFPGHAPVSSADEEEPFALLERSLAQQHPSAASDAAVVVLSTAVDLLTALIGESLTTRLLREAWPDDFASERSEETIT